MYSWRLRTFRESQTFFLLARTHIQQSTTLKFERMCFKLIISVIFLIYFNVHCATSEITEQYCKDTLEGAWIGSQCFFAPPTTADWNSAWSVCAGFNATLAQIHSSMEFEAIYEMLNASISGNASFWIAMQTTPDGSLSTKCAVTNATSYWYDTVATPNPQMPADSTWIRSRGCDNIVSTDDNYVQIVYIDRSMKIGAAQLGGRTEWDNYQLCQLSNFGRYYTNSVSCMLETPIEKYVASTIDECARACSCKMWCRSLNYVSDATCSGSCELYSFSDREPCPGCPSMGSKNNCTHYNLDMDQKPKPTPTGVAPDDDQVDEDPAQFEKACKNTYDGVINGGRCFFMANDPTSNKSQSYLVDGVRTPKFTTTPWDKAFELCRSSGGALAQIHTSSEWEAIKTKHKGILSLVDKASSLGIKPELGFIWIAAKQDPPLFNITTTFWYNKDGTPDPRLTGKATYFKLHATDFGNDHTEPCFHLYTTNANFGDIPNAEEVPALCVRYNIRQSYTRITNKCMTESVIATLNQAAGTPDCAAQCSQYVWCRSYNIRDGGTLCEFFSWHYNDTSNVKSGVSDCSYYAYDP